MQPITGIESAFIVRVPGKNLGVQPRIEAESLISFSDLVDRSSRSPHGIPDNSPKILSKIGRAPVAGAVWSSAVQGAEK
jgi:hypothetical protein